MQPWRTVRKTPLLSFGKWLTVESHLVELPNGQEIDDWPWIITPDYANVIAFTTTGDFLCFRQVKYAVEGETFAPVGGYLEPDEDPLAAAKRELLEETGYSAADWTSLGSYVVDANRGAGTGHFFLARNAIKVTERNADDLEEQELILLHLTEAEKALMAGQFKTLPWAAAVALAILAVKKE